MKGILLLLLVAFSDAQSGSNSPQRSHPRIATPPHDHQQEGINWSDFGELVPIDKDSEWQEYHQNTINKNEHNPKKRGRPPKPPVIVDETFQTKAKTQNGIERAKKKWLLQKTDPEKFKKTRRKRYDQDREREAKILSGPIEKRQKYLEEKRQKAVMKTVRHKERTGYTNFRSSKVNRLKSLVKNEKATPEDIAELFRLREKDRIRHIQHRQQKKLERSKTGQDNQKKKI